MRTSLIPIPVDNVFVQIYVLPPISQSSPASACEMALLEMKKDQVERAITLQPLNPNAVGNKPEDNAPYRLGIIRLDEDGESGQIVEEISCKVYRYTSPPSHSPAIIASCEDYERIKQAIDFLTDSHPRKATLH